MAGGQFRPLTAAQLQELELQRRKAALPPHPTHHALHNLNGDTPGQIHVYSREEKQQIIRRYLAKKKTRRFRKVIRYACRKRFADRRPRVGGRFVKMKPDADSKEKKRGKITDAKGVSENMGPAPRSSPDGLMARVDMAESSPVDHLRLSKLEMKQSPTNDGSQSMSASALRRTGEAAIDAAVAAVRAQVYDR